MKDYTTEINAAIRTLGSIALDESKRVCPVRTGRLKRSIALRTQHDRARNSDACVIGTDVPYALDVEFGGRGRRPKPFLETGLETARKSVPVIFSLFMKGDRR